MKALVPALAALAVLLAGAAPGRAGPPAPHAPPPATPEVERRCPEVMRGVVLVARPIAGGVALEFTSPRQHEVPELRQQLRDAALVVEMHSKAPVEPAAGAADADHVRIPPLEISVDDVSAGARVTIRAAHARDLPELLHLARALELFWARSDCSQAAGASERVVMPFQRV